MFPFFSNKSFPFFQDSQSSSGNPPAGPNINQNQSFPFHPGSQNQQGFNPFDYDNHEFEEENPFSHHFMYPLPPKPKEQKQTKKETTSKNKKETTPPISKQLEAMVLDEDGLVDVDKVEKGYKKFMEYAVKVSPAMKNFNDFLK
ncbi:hypothetical protein [Alkalihalobacterium sp. APHAB7]|uniref:hypothetical protein n=1 Tax=Alkalihalobacterium sp. APHAB7 TaxID=3402081 RepID=UPI003AAA3323